jgi:hypothetical protein
MPFSGGGGGDLPNHEHSNVPLDGGPLDMANVTIGSLANGSMTYSDGNALQELTAGAAGESLQISGGVPTWQAGGAAGVYQFVESFTTGSTSDWDESLASSIDLADYDMVIEYDLKQTANGTLGFRINDISSGNWYTSIKYVTLAGNKDGNKSEMYLTNNENITTGNFNVYVKIYLTAGRGLHLCQGQFWTNNPTEQAWSGMLWNDSGAGSPATVSSIQLLSSGTFEDGKCYVWKVSRT